MLGFALIRLLYRFSDVATLAPRESSELEIPPESSALVQQKTCECHLLKIPDDNRLSSNTRCVEDQVVVVSISCSCVSHL